MQPFPFSALFDGIIDTGVRGMKLLKTKIWNWRDIALLKWSALLAGMVIGAYFHEYVTKNTWVIVVCVLLFALRPAAEYFKD
jgi:hypothetical protein